MSKASTPTELLIVAVQDLYDGEAAWGDRLPEIARHVSDAALAEFAEGQLERARTQAGRLEQMARMLDAEPRGSDNLWLRANLADAKRDTETVEEGVLLDIALVGAWRKAIQSERVSYETAVALAEAIGNFEAAALLTATRDEEAGSDAKLAAMLERLAASCQEPVTS